MPSGKKIKEMFKSVNESPFSNKAWDDYLLKKKLPRKLKKAMKNYLYGKRKHTEYRIVMVDEAVDHLI